METIPKIGDVESRVKFAYLPEKVESKWIWLKKYIGIYKYHKHIVRREFDDIGLVTTTYTYHEQILDWEMIDSKLIYEQDDTK